ncbi:hypothetical protein [Motiliproteus sp.]|uniref:hypothetical protein n=1 Tax=Motiliproteus sp. TaxID=1898955 RepID=UPI003BAB304A
MKHFLINTLKSSKPVRTGLLGLFLLVAAPVQAATDSSLISSPRVADQVGAYAGVEPLDLSAMDQMRGGFSFGNLEMRFGATLSTLIDKVRLDTVFNITERGAEVVSQALTQLAQINPASVTTVQQTIAAATTQTTAKPPTDSVNNNTASTHSTISGPAASVTPVTGTPSALPAVPVEQVVAAPSPAAQPATSISTPSTTAAQVVTPTVAPSTVTATGTSPSSPTVQSAPQPSAATAQSSTAVVIGPDNPTSITDLTPVGIKLDGLTSSGNFGGLVINNQKGFTAAVHKLTREAAISAVISNANNLKVQQKLDIRIEVANTKSARQAAMRAAMGRLAGGMFR